MEFPVAHVAWVQPWGCVLQGECACPAFMQTLSDQVPLKYLIALNREFVDARGVSVMTDKSTAGNKDCLMT
eukprot:8845822-Alexandrium_andersonii.AAC.1